MRQALIEQPSEDVKSSPTMGRSIGPDQSGCFTVLRGSSGGISWWTLMFECIFRVSAVISSPTAPKETSNTEGGGGHRRQPPSVPLTLHRSFFFFFFFFLKFITLSFYCHISKTFIIKKLRTEKRTKTKKNYKILKG